MAIASLQAVAEEIDELFKQNEIYEIITSRGDTAIRVLYCSYVTAKEHGGNALFHRALVKELSV